MEGTVSPPAERAAAETCSLPAGFGEYEEGKHRRYELLFKVNGAAFAIVALAFKPETRDFIRSVIGLPTLAVGMALFTLAMGVDIFAFGWGMKQLDGRFGKVALPPLKGRFTPLGKGLFRPVGVAVLGFIVALIVVGWVLVAINSVDFSH